MGPQSVSVYMQCCKVNFTAVPTVTTLGMYQKKLQ